LAPDWAIFHHLGHSKLWKNFKKSQKWLKKLGYFFEGIIYELFLRKKYVGLYFERFFTKSSGHPGAHGMIQRIFFSCLLICPFEESEIIQCRLSGY
jgi:hypothetical protein